MLISFLHTVALPLPHSLPACRCRRPRPSPHLSLVAHLPRHSPRRAWRRWQPKNAHASYSSRIEYGSQDLAPAATLLLLFPIWAAVSGQGIGRVFGISKQRGEALLAGDEGISRLLLLLPIRGLSHLDLLVRLGHSNRRMGAGPPTNAKSPSRNNARVSRCVHAFVCD